MCFEIHKDHPTVKIAEKDIKCFKILEKVVSKNILRSPYRGMKYELNILYKDPYNLGENSIKEWPYMKSCSIVEHKSITIGYHSYSIKEIACFDLITDDTKLYNAIIPKGSLYFYNPNDYEYVSNQIIIKEEINSYIYITINYIYSISQQL